MIHYPHKSKPQSSWQNVRSRQKLSTSSPLLQSIGWLRAYEKLICKTESLKPTALCVLFCNKILFRLREISGSRNNVSKTAVTVLKKQGHNLHCNQCAVQNVCRLHSEINSIICSLQNKSMISGHTDTGDEDLRNHNVRLYSRCSLRNTENYLKTGLREMQSFQFSLDYLSIINLHQA